MPSRALNERRLTLCKQGITIGAIEAQCYYISLARSQNSHIKQLKGVSWRRIVKGRGISPGQYCNIIAARCLVSQGANISSNPGLRVSLYNNNSCSVKSGRWWVDNCGNFQIMILLAPRRAILELKTTGVRPYYFGISPCTRNREQPVSSLLVVE